MLLWLLSVSLVAFVVLIVIASGGLSVRRYSGSDVVAQLAVGGRSLYFSRTPDGCGCGCDRAGACVRTAAAGASRRSTAACVSRAGRLDLDRSRA